MPFGIPGKHVTAVFSKPPKGGSKKSKGGQDLNMETCQYPKKIKKTQSSKKPTIYPLKTAEKLSYLQNRGQRLKEAVRNQSKWGVRGEHWVMGGAGAQK